MSLVVGAVVCAVSVIRTIVCLDDEAFPLARMVTGEAWSRTAHRRDQVAAVERVPASMCVVADDRLVPLLTRSNRVSLPGVLSRLPDFLLLDLSQEEAGSVRGLDLRTTTIRDDALADGYRVVARFGDVEVLESAEYRGPSVECAR